MKAQVGFTLIELIVVIVLLAILAASALPKFVNLSEDAYQAKAQGYVGSMRAAVKLANMKWRALGSPTSLDARNDIQLYGNSRNGQIDINVNGYPAQSYAGSDVVISTDNDDDCLSLWQALIEQGANNAALDDSSEILVNYEPDGTCSYKFVANLNFGFIYNPITGAVNSLN